MPTDSLYPDPGLLTPSPVSPRADLAARRASLVRMNAVTKDKSKKKKPKLDPVNEGAAGEVCGRAGRVRQDGNLRRGRGSRGSKKGSMKKKGPGIPMPFFNPQNNFQKAFKLFPDLAVSQHFLPCKHAIMCQNRAGTGPLLAASAQYMALNSISYMSDSR